MAKKKFSFDKESHGSFIMIGNYCLSQTHDSQGTPTQRHVEVETEMLIDLIKDRDQLLNDLKNIVDSTEDKNGQFSSWHKHLRQTTNEAKETISKIEG